MTDEHMIAGQYVLTLATIARNHVPCSLTGVPPYLALTGRADILAGCAATVRNSDPESPDFLIKQKNPIWNIPNAMNSATAAPRAPGAIMSRNLPGRSKQFFPIGGTVRVADKGKCIDPYRAIAHAPGNLS